MIAHQLTLIRREIWEHPAIWVSPLVIALIVSMLTLTGQVSVSAFGEAVDFAIVGAQNADEVHRAAIMTGALTAIASIFAFGAWIVMIFYSLDALYAERKDKSILFWRSLPITDAETVVSKLLTALFVIPVVTVVGLYLGILIGNSVLTEIVFNRPGLGKLIIGALNQRDYTMLQGMMVIYTLIVVLVNLLTDLTYGLIDPRIKYS